MSLYVQSLLAAALAVGLFAARASPAQGTSGQGASAAAEQPTFATPEEAAQALVAAVRARDRGALLAVVGPDSSDWLFSGDPVADANDWKKFLAAYDERHALVPREAGTTLVVGRDDWPFPAPIVRRGARWAFDANAGREEIIDRRVGRNELDTIQTMLAIVDAQREYAMRDPDRDGLVNYARRFRSTAGQRDGLFWPVNPGEPPSPLGAFVASAATEGYQLAEAQPQQPYHGYYFRILESQGPAAHGGAYDYLVGDRLLGGFAVVAYPARYGVSGVTTFLVNHEGTVFQKDLGPNTAQIAGTMRSYDPDRTWTPSQ